ncbi:MAG: hypothetical protein P8Y70_15025 [Candidatus Lokiarchaeota archaeon]
MRDTFKVVIFGKSKFKKDFLRDTTPFSSNGKLKSTIGVEFRLWKPSEELIAFQLWIFDDNKKLEFLYPNYCLNAKGGLFLYDFNDVSSFNYLDEWLKIIENKIEKTCPFPIIAVGLTSESEEEIEIPFEKDIELIKSMGIEEFLICNVNSYSEMERVFLKLRKIAIKWKEKVKEQIQV